MKSKIKHFLSATFWIVLSKILPKRGRGLYFIGEVVGRCFYLFCTTRVKIMEEELGKIFPEKGPGEIRQIARKSTIDYCTSEVEQICFPSLSADNIDSLITIDGKQRLDDALALGKGVIAIQPHFGAYMLNLPVLGFNGYKVNQIALRGNPPPEIIEKVPEMERKGFNRAAYEHRLTKFESSLPAEFINAKLTLSMRKVHEKLKKNEIVAVSGTGRGGKKFVPVKLCGREALLSFGPFSLAMRSGAVLLPMFIVRDADMKNRMVIEEPIKIAADGDRESIRLAVQEFADLMTDYLRRYPEHFGMRLWRMRAQAHYDDHPFFTDYPQDNPRRGTVG